MDDHQLMQLSQDLPKRWAVPRVSLDTIQSTLRFLEEISLGWKGGATQSIVIGECEIKDLPFLNVSLAKGDAWTSYEKLAVENNGLVYGCRKIGYESFSSLYDGLTKMIEEKHALSYYFTDALRAITSLGEIVERQHVLWKQFHKEETCPQDLREEFDSLSFNFDDLGRAVKEAHCHLKYGLRSHVKLDTCDGDSVHCGRYAVGKACGTAKHSANTCTECMNYIQLPDAIRMMMNAVANTLAREHQGDPNFSSEKAGGPVNELQTMGEPLTACARTLNLYHRHVLRAVWQSNAVREVVQNLKVGEVLIILDHKQKIEPVNFNESSEEYYGKKGISLLGFAVRWRTVENGPIQTHFVDAVSLNSKQDGVQVQAILTQVFPLITQLIPAARRVILLSDNGAAFTCKENMKYVWKRNKDFWGLALTVTRWIFFEAQCGKTILDTHFAYVGLLIRRFARKVRAVKLHQDVFDALADGDGIANTTTVLIIFPADVDDDEPIQATSEDVAIQQVRRIHDIIFNGETVTTFAYSGVEKSCQEYNFNAEQIRPQVEARIEQTFRSPKTSFSSTTVIASNVTSASGPIVSISSKASPHAIRLTEQIVAFATENGHVEPQRLLNQAIVSEAIVEDATNKKKKIKLQLEDFRATFNLAWADSELRKTPALSVDLVNILKQLVSVNHNQS